MTKVLFICIIHFTYKIDENTPAIYRMKKKFKRYRRYYVYILQCRNGTYYTGYTPDLEKRVALHNKGRGAKYTRDRRPVKLVWCKEYRYYLNALHAERKIKKLSHQQKQALVKLYEKAR